MTATTTTLDVATLEALLTEIAAIPDKVGRIDLTAPKRDAAYMLNEAITKVLILSKLAA